VTRSAPEPTASATRIARVVVDGAPAHLAEPLDYLIPDGLDLHPGTRVEVPFAGRRSRGLVVGLGAGSELAPGRLRAVHRPLGAFAWVRDDELDVLRWAADRFAAPLADVVRHALPDRVVDVERAAARAGWLPPEGPVVAPPPRAAGPAPDVPEGWRAYGAEGVGLHAAAHAGGGTRLWRPLPGEDVAVRLAELVAACLAGGRDALVVVPDPASPTADAVIAAAAAADVEVVDVRGGPDRRAAYRAWLRCRAGVVRVAVGERAAAFLPLAHLGLAVVLDEASPVHKERRSPRHHVREVVLERARRAGAVGLAIGTVPSATAQGLVAAGRLALVAAAPDAVASRRPLVHVATGAGEARARLSRASHALLRRATVDGYAVVLAARRGEGRALVCTRCGDLVRCPRCAAAVARASDGGRWCPSCGESSRRPPACARCGPGPLSPLAAGAARLGDELRAALQVPVVVLEGHARTAPPPPSVLVMTRGSVLDRPPPLGPVRGVVLPDLEGSLRRPALDAAEDALRLAFAVAAWTVAGRAAPPAAGEPDVVVEARDPEHHALRALVAWDPDVFWSEETRLRAAVRLPPAVAVVRLEVRPGRRGERTDVRRDLGAVLPEGDELAGPLPLEDGGEAWLLRTADRPRSLAALVPVRAAWVRAGTDFRVDVDPVGLD
jgi:primosomal protein N' (replication factor Y)